MAPYNEEAFRKSWGTLHEIARDYPQTLSRIQAAFETAAAQIRFLGYCHPDTIAKTGRQIVEVANQCGIELWRREISSRGKFAFTLILPEGRTGKLGGYLAINAISISIESQSASFAVHETTGRYYRHALSRFFERTGYGLSEFLCDLNQAEIIGMAARAVTGSRKEYEIYCPFAGGLMIGRWRPSGYKQRRVGELRRVGHGSDHTDRLCSFNTIGNSHQDAGLIEWRTFVDENKLRPEQIAVADRLENVLLFAREDLDFRYGEFIGPMLYHDSEHDEVVSARLERAADAVDVINLIIAGGTDDITEPSEAELALRQPQRISASHAVKQTPERRDIALRNWMPGLLDETSRRAAVISLFQ